MFEGTSWWFRVLYFLTAMSPAYVLFLIQIEEYCYLSLLLIIGIFAYVLKFFIKRRVKNREGVGLPNYKIDSISNKNGEITAFLLGVVVPSVLNFSDSIIIQIFCFVGLQLLLFILMIRSSSIFPNVLMIIFGMNTFEIEDGKYIISFSDKIISHQENTISIRRLGDSEMCMVYVKE